VFDAMAILSPGMFILAEALKNCFISETNDSFAMNHSKSLLLLNVRSVSAPLRHQASGPG
jgi:hypothetical protein